MLRDFPNFENLKLNQSLAQFATLRVGGTAEAVFTAVTVEALKNALVYSHQHNIRPIILGGGSNVLISDKPINGLVIINRCQGWEELEPQEIAPIMVGVKSRWQLAGKYNSPLTESLEYPIVRVRAEGGCLISRLMLELLDKKIIGLEWFAGIPGTVGGAIFTNMHGGNIFFGNLVESARLFSNGKTIEVKNDYFKFKYDWSVLFDTREIVLDAVLQLRRGPITETRKFIADWIKKKNESQEKMSCGCI